MFSPSVEEQYREPLISPVSAASTSTTPPTPLHPQIPNPPNQGVHENAFESLDFETLINSFTKSISSTTKLSQNPTRPSRTLIGYTGRTFVRWLLTILTGLCTGGVAICIVWNIDVLTELRERALSDSEEEMTNDERSAFDYVRVFVLFLSWNLLLSLPACLLTVLFAPKAAGSGIPEVKAYLNGVNIKGFMTLKTILVKTIGTTLSVASGLAVGPEGPLVHLGAAIGGGVTRTGKMVSNVRALRISHPRLARVFGCGHVDEPMASSWLSRGLGYMTTFRNDGERRDFICIGSACGFAAAFGAPIGGILFAFEEVGSHFPSRMLWRTLIGTSIATFCIAVYSNDLTNYGVLTLDSIKTPDGDVLKNRFGEIPYYAVLGALGGVIGAGFNTGWRKMMRRRMAFHKGRHWWYKLAEVASLSMLTSALTFALPIAFSYFACRDPPETQPDDDGWGPWMADDDGSGDDFVDDFGSRFNCGVNQTNELASVFFGSREEAIKNILRDPSTFDERTLLVVGFLFLPLLLVTFGSHIPCGLFMPTILIGGSLGGYAGIIIERHFMSGVSPATFALVGATALLGGIQRSTVSLCVIIMEGTGETKFLIPIVVTTVVSKWVGDHFTEGIYEIGIELKGYPYLDHHVHKAWDQAEVRDVMTEEVVTIRGRATAAEIERVLNSTAHNGFPVVGGGEMLLGIVRRDQLAAMVECGVFVREESLGAEGGDHSLLEEEEQRVMRHSHNGNMERSTSDNNWAEFYSSTCSGIVPVRSMSDDTTVGVRRNMSFVSEPVTAALAVGNDCKFPAEKKQPSTPGRGRASSGDVRGSATRQSVLLDTVFVIKDDLGVDNDSLPTVTVPEEDRGRSVNVASVMNLAPHAVAPNTPLGRTYRLFTNMGLRHLTVVERGRVVGMVTRKDLESERIKEKLKQS